MKFRPHRGSLEDSLAGVVEVASVDELRRILRLGPERIEVLPYGYDERIKWNTHIVLVNGSPVGFTDGPLSDGGRSTA